MEGEALGAVASPEASGVASVSGFLLKNSIFLFNAAKALWPDSAKSESGPGYKAAGLAKSRGPRGNTGDSAPANAAEIPLPEPQCPGHPEMLKRSHQY